MRRGLVTSRTPPEWNVRVLTEEDFNRYCSDAGIVISETQLEQPGLYMGCDGHPHIFLNDNLRGPERLFVVFHELAHYWLHPANVGMFLGYSTLIEIEADVVGICALIPKTVLTHYWPSEIAELYNYPHSLVSLRCEVFDRWHI